MNGLIASLDGTLRCLVGLATGMHHTPWSIAATADRAHRGEPLAHIFTTARPAMGIPLKCSRERHPAAYSVRVPAPVCVRAAESAQSGSLSHFLSEPAYSAGSGSRLCS
ncbi:MAG TPA: hypothetical protein VGF67_14095 [Ktedonobacteraceae bacterium]